MGSLMLILRKFSYSLRRTCSSEEPHFYGKRKSELLSNPRLLDDIIVSFKNSYISTVELQWPEHLWNHENMFKPGVVQANEC